MIWLVMFLVFLVFFVAILTAFIVFMTTRQMDLLDKQIEEMKVERLLKQQPFLYFNNLEFQIERPRLFYTPPEDKYSFLARYCIQGEINNISESPALFVDIYPRLIIFEDNQSKYMESSTTRLNIISKNISSDENSFHSIFVEDSTQKFMYALRDSNVDSIPQLELEIYYKTASGGFYCTSRTYYITADEENLEIIRNWHCIITQAPIKYKENIETIREFKKEHVLNSYESMYEQIRDDFNKSLSTENSKIKLSLHERSESFVLKQISESEYKSQAAHYGRFVGECRGKCVHIKK